MNDLKTVAVGFDGSPDSQAAVYWALSLARQLDAEVVLVHAVGLLEHTRRDSVADELTAIMTRLTLERGVDPSRVRLLVVDGDACSALLRCADEPVGADMLVVGSRGAGAHAGLLLGSTSLELAEHTTIPLVVVPHHRSAGA